MLPHKAVIRERQCTSVHRVRTLVDIYCIQKNNGPQQQLLDNTAGTNSSARKRKQVMIQGKPPPTDAGSLIQPNNLKVDELIALIQAENFDVIAVNKTLLGTTQNKHLPAEVTIHGCKAFHVTNSDRKARWINRVCQKHLEPNRKSTPTCTREIIQVDINPKNAVQYT